MDSNVRSFRWGAVFLQSAALIFAVIGVSTMDWYVVTYDISNQSEYAHFSITGRLEQDYIVSPNSVSPTYYTLTYNVWDGSVACTGTCSSSFLSNTLTCSSLQSNINGVPQNQWIYNTLCPYAETTLAFVVLGLFLNLIAILMTGLSAVDFLDIRPSAAVCISASVSYFIGIAVWGGGSGAREKDGWFGTNAQGQMGFSYILAVTAMFVCGVASVLCLLSNSPQQRQISGQRAPVFQQQVDMSPASVRWSGTTRTLDPSYASPYVQSQYIQGPKLISTSPVQQSSLYPLQTVQLGPVTQSYRTSPQGSPRRVYLADSIDQPVQSAPFSNQYYYRDTNFQDYA